MTTETTECPVDRFEARDFREGDSLWFQSRVRWSPSRYLTVEKVDRKWVYLASGDRFCKTDRDRLHLDGKGYTPNGEVFRTKQEAEVFQEVQNLYARFCKAFQYSRRKTDVTVEHIRQAAELLQSRWKTENLAVTASDTLWTVSARKYHVRHVPKKQSNQAGC